MWANAKHEHGSSGATPRAVLREKRERGWRGEGGGAVAATAAWGFQRAFEPDVMPASSSAAAPQPGPSGGRYPRHTGGAGLGSHNAGRGPRHRVGTTTTTSSSTSAHTRGGCTAGLRPYTSTSASASKWGCRNSTVVSDVACPHIAATATATSPDPGVVECGRCSTEQGYTRVAWRSWCDLRRPMMTLTTCRQESAQRIQVTSRNGLRYHVTT